MKKIYVTFAIVSLFFIISCTKDTVTPTPATPKADTLTSGWKKLVIDSSETYSDVFFQNNTTGYLAGNKTYKSSDGGLTWNAISNQSFVNLGVTSNGNAFFAGGGNGLFKSANGTGPLTSVLAATSVSSDVFFVDNSNGYYLDETGLFNSTDGGENWAKLATTGINFTGNLYPTLFFNNNTTGWITGQNTVYKTNGSPANWVAASFTGTAPKALFTSVFSTPDHTVYTLAENHELFKSTDGGTTFSLIQTFQTTFGGYFGDIYFVDNNTGYVSGGNKIYKTADAGSTWSTVATLANTQIIEIHFSDAHHGWASCTNGTVLIYNN